MPTIDDLIKTYRERLKRAKEIKRLIADDPEFARDLLRALAPDVAETEPVSEATASTEKMTVSARLTHLKRIIAFFKANGNRWARLKTVEDSIGVKRNRFVHCFYDPGYRRRFESKKDPRRKGGKLWRLKREPERGTGQLLLTGKEGQR